MGTVEIVLIVAASVIGLAALIYGFFRRASRVSWIGWQVFLLFALTFLLDVVPLPAGTLGPWLAVGVFVLALGADLLLGGLIRSRVMKCERPSGHVRRLSRVLGALCSLLNIALLFAMFLALVLAVCTALPAPPAVFAPIYGSAVWQKFLARHAFDLFLIAFVFVFSRAGLRLGVIRGLYYLLMYALTFASLIGAILMATKVGVFAGWGAALAAKFPTLLPSAASVIGHGVFAVLFFLLFFALSMLLGFFLHKGLRRLLDCRPLGMISALLLFLLFLAVFFALLWGVYFGVAQAGGLQGPVEGLGSIVQRAEGIFLSSPLSAAFYRCNPFLLLLG